VWHVVVAKVGERIVKVHCKQCGKEHRHKPPGGAPAKVPSAHASTARPGTRTKTRKPQPQPVGPPTFDPARPPRPYRPLEAYTVGDRISHPTFGAGVVESSPGPGKVSVWFESGRRVLAMAKPALALQRPSQQRGADE
jgi:hypothetical protein